MNCQLKLLLFEYLSVKFVEIDFKYIETLSKTNILITATTLSLVMPCEIGNNLFYILYRL